MNLILRVVFNLSKVAKVNGFAWVKILYAASVQTFHLNKCGFILNSSPLIFTVYVSAKLQDRY